MDEWDPNIPEYGADLDIGRHGVVLVCDPSEDKGKKDMRMDEKLSEKEEKDASDVKEEYREAVSVMENTSADPCRYWNHGHLLPAY